MVSGDAEALARERAELAGLSARPLLRRWLAYARMTGPGWLQSAMTLGGGSAVASLTLGAFFGYRLLWLQPLAMVLGIVMLSAMSHQTLSTGARPFGAMKRHVAPSIAWAWAIASLAATVIWHFPQYALAAGMAEDMVATSTGWSATGAGRTALLLAIGLAVLALSTAITWNYASGWKGIRLYERALKLMVWGIIAAFAAVIVRGTILAKIRWGEVLTGFLPLHVPTTAKGIESLMGAFGAAVGINMTFLFPYTLLARGWGREHRGLSRFDLISGMLIPFVVATSLMTIATAAAVHEPGSVPSAAKITPVAAAQSLAETMGFAFGHIVFGLGILGMVLSSIITHMLVCGFAACEVFGIEPTGWRYRLACLIPAPGMLGVVLWKHMGLWIAVRTSAICGILLPIAYIAFFVLNNKREYLGDDRPTGAKALAWNVAMGAAIAATVASIAYFLVHNYDKVLGIDT
jgi:Mn2+/Fe2+ NRAMP family transporter